MNHYKTIESVLTELERYYAQKSGVNHVGATVALESLRELQAQQATSAAGKVSWNLRYADSTPKLNVGYSAFEDWFQQQPFATQIGVKQMCRDSYAAGMGDPLVTYANPQSTPPAQQAQQATSAEGMEWEVRGLLASNLKCWHRLTDEESDELVKLLQSLKSDDGSQLDPQKPAGAADMAIYRAIARPVLQPAQQAQKPVAAECRFDNETEWKRCTVAHHLLVKAHPKEWPHYETRVLYTGPQRELVQQARDALVAIYEYERTDRQNKAIAACDKWLGENP